MMLRIWLRGVETNFTSYIITYKRRSVFWSKGIINLLLLWMVLLSSCQYVEPSDPFQEGTWVAEFCNLVYPLYHSSTISISIRDFYMLSQKTITIRRDFFLDDNCTSSEKILEQQLILYIQKKYINDDGYLQLDVLAGKSEYYSLGRSDDLNNIRFCSIETWENFKKKDANEEYLINCSSFFYTMYFPEGDVGILEFYIKENALYDVDFNAKKQKKISGKYVWLR